MTSCELVIQTPTLPVKILHERVSPATPPQCASALADSTASSGGHKLYPLAKRPAPGVVGRTADAAFMMAPMSPRVLLPRRPEASGEPFEGGSPFVSAFAPPTALGALGEGFVLLPPSGGGLGDAARSREGGGMGRPSL